MVRKLLMIVVAFGPLVAFGQFKEFGLTLGGNMSGVTGNVAHQEARAGLTLGAFGAYEFSDKIQLQMDLQYNQLGASYNDPNLGMAYDINLNYIQVPISIKYIFNQRFGVTAGGYFAFLGGSSASGTLAGENFDPTVYARGGDGGLAFGFTYETYENLRFRISFQQGLVDIHDHPNADTGTALNGFKNCDQSLRTLNQSVQFTIAYAFKNF